MPRLLPTFGSEGWPGRECNASTDCQLIEKQES
jgi:hypothetical protein